MVTRFKFWFLKDCLFGGVKLAKTADPDKYVYGGHGIGFDSRSEYSLLDSSVCKNVIIFGVDLSSSVHMDNKKKDILILDIGPTQRLDDTTLSAEVQYSINFSRSNTKFCLNLHYIGNNIFLFVNATKNISIQSKRFWNKKISLMFRKYFRFFSQ